MSDDRIRLSLHRKLDELVGSEEAQLLMERVPPFNWHEIATKADLLALRGDVSALRAELLQAIDVQAVRTDSSVKDAFARQTWQLTGLLLASQALMAGILGLLIA